ncbi:FYVE zinc finger domain-containing protein [Stigmatella hybrida]|uniref:hypothetical protein n=1 Tax=Stigmatella hybrida TaxID=394097 RepID=UPI001CDB0742|nr:hypothetical protein [Stigmatella hybrida]
MSEQQAPLAYRKELLELAVDALSKKLVSNDTGVALFPEYFFAEPTSTTQNHGRGDIRSLDEDEKDDFFRFVQQVSEKYPKVIIFPGTIAWHKSFTRQGTRALHSHGPQIGTPKAISRYHKAAAALQTSHQRAFGVAYNPNSALAGNLDAWDGGYFLPATSFNTASLGTVSPTLSVTLNPGTVMTRYVNKYSDTYGSRVHQVQTFENTPSAKQRLVRNTAYVFQGGYCKFKYNKQGDFHEVLGGSNHFAYVPGVANGVFKLDNITFGVEVCLDHAIGFLTRNYPGTVDIHVVMSATVPINLANIKAGNGGHIIHADAVPTNSGVWKFRTAGPARLDIPGGNQTTLTFVNSLGHMRAMKAFRILPTHAGGAGPTSADSMLQKLDAFHLELAIAPGQPGALDWSVCLTRINEINEVWAKLFKHRFTPTDATTFLQASKDLRAAVAALFSPPSQYPLSGLWASVKTIRGLVDTAEPNKKYAAALKKACDDYVPLRQTMPGAGGGNKFTVLFTSSLKDCVCVDCGLRHAWTVSTAYSGNWHHCTACKSTYCPPCGKALTSVGKLSRERTCRNCQGRTTLTA